MHASDLQLPWWSKLRWRQTSKEEAIHSERSILSKLVKWVADDALLGCYLTTKPFRESGSCPWACMLAQSPLPHSTGVQHSSSRPS
jgi:hypothetical protein